MIKNILSITDKILDLLPGRREHILNQMDDLKNELKLLQSKTGHWTARDSIRYNDLSERLSKLEKRSQHAK